MENLSILIKAINKERPLAEKMKVWAKIYRELSVLEESIKKEVLSFGKTLDVDNVRASYSKGRGSYDYELAGKDAPIEVIEKNSSEMINWSTASGSIKIEELPPHVQTILNENKIKYTDWKSVCEEAGFDMKPYYTAGTPKVTLKLMD